MMPPILLAAALNAQAAPSPKIDIVSVTGCLKEAAPNAWNLSSATDPVASNANAPAAKDIPSTPPAGKNEFRPVVVKGLFIKATPTSRLNITSVTMVAPTCVAPAK
jgi:hypothetical protein